MLVFPAPVLALGLNDLFLSPRTPEWFARLYDGPIPLLWGQLVRALPFAVIVLASGIEQLDVDALESAVVSGAGPWTLLFRIALPPLQPSIVLAWLVCAAFLLTELPATKLLAAPGAEPLSVRVFSLLHWGTANQQAALCLVVLFVVACLAAGVYFAAQASAMHLPGEVKTHSGQ
jgi:iron(III) transport system permease protein